MQRRLWLLGGVFALVLSVFWLRLVQLQVLDGDYYQALIHDDRTVVRFIPARRGKLLDRWGVPLVDNGAEYHVALRLQDLELPSPQRWRQPFEVFSPQDVQQLLADLARRVALPAEELAQIVDQQFRRSPGVGIRYRRVDQPLQPKVLVVPADGSELPPRLWQRLRDSGLLRSDPLLVLQQALRQEYDPQCWVLTANEADQLIEQLAAWSQRDQALVRSVVWPFLLPMQVSLPEMSAAVEPLAQTKDSVVSAQSSPALSQTVSISAVMIDDDQQSAVIEALADLLSVPRAQIADRWQQLVRLQKRQRQQQAGEVGQGMHHVAFIAWSALQRLGLSSAVLEVLPSLELSGLPKQRERWWVIQDSLPTATDESLLQLLAHRLAASLSYDGAEVARLLRQHGSDYRLSQLRRAFRRTHQIVFDSTQLRRWIDTLVAQVQAHGVNTDVLSVEQAITAARRKADRGWAGETYRDPLVVLADIPQSVAVALQSFAGSSLRSLGSWPQTQGFAVQQSAHVVEPALAALPNLPGLSIRTDLGREYPHGASASLVVGWLSRLSAQMARDEALFYGLDPMGWVGSQGLEQVYDTMLQGVIGREVLLRQPTGPQVLPERGRPPQPGRDVVTTIDLELQRLAEDSLINYLSLADQLQLVKGGHDGVIARQAHRVNHGKAGMVVMDCHTGEVLALASTPTIDLNNFRQRYQQWIDPQQFPGLPLIDHAAVPAMPPGSTVKPLVGLAAMLDGHFAADETLHTPGYRLLISGRPLMKDHPVAPRDWTMEDAIIKSSNSFFAHMAERLGPRRLNTWYRRFGIGAELALDIPWARSGRLVGPDDVARYRPTEPHWNPYDTWSMGIGQFMRPCASPLQLVTIPAAIANGGTILRPHLWRGVSNQAVAEQLDIPLATLSTVRRGMEGVTQPGGTARKLVLQVHGQQVAVAAKTGTSQWGSPSSQARGDTPDNSWLIGYAPAHEPQVAFAIYLHATGLSGGRACTGVAKRVLERYFEIQASRDP